MEDNRSSVSRRIYLPNSSNLWMNMITHIPLCTLAGQTYQVSTQTFFNPKKNHHKAWKHTHRLFRKSLSCLFKFNQRKNRSRWDIHEGLRHNCYLIKCNLSGSTSSLGLMIYTCTKLTPIHSLILHKTHMRPDLLLENNSYTFLCIFRDLTASLMPTFLVFSSG